jgi:hypothetical protein
MARDAPGRERTVRFLAAPTDAGYLGNVSRSDPQPHRLRRPFPDGAALDARPCEATTEEDVHLVEHAQHQVALRAAVDDITPA